jgi:hypothetical protein
MSSSVKEAGMVKILVMTADPETATVACFNLDWERVKASFIASAITLTLTTFISVDVLCMNGIDVKLSIL